MADYFQHVYDAGILNGKFNQIGDNMSRWKTTLLNPKQRGIKGFMDTITAPIRNGLEYRENWFRVSNFIDAYERTGDWKKAARIAKMSSLDFTNLTEFERRYMKRAIPFYGFLRSNLEQQLTQIDRDPRKLVYMQRIIDNIKKVMSGNTITEEEWDAIPNWVKDGIVIPIDKSKEGITLMSNFGEPTQVYNDLINLESPSDFVKGLVSSTNPLFKFPIELMAGYSSFSEKNIQDLNRGTRWRKYPDFIKKLLNYKGSDYLKNEQGEIVSSPTVNPMVAYLLSNTPYVSPFTVQMGNAAGIPKDPVMALLNTSGILGGKVQTRNQFMDQKLLNEQ